MKSPLNISETVKRYGLDEQLTLKLRAFDMLIWQDIKVNTVDNLIAFEKNYKEYGNEFSLCYDSDVNEFSSVFMYDGEMTLLSKGTFQRISESGGELHTKLVNAGLTDLESVYVRAFLADISGLYRKDSYHFGVPPFIQSVCDGLNNALAKLPSYSDIVVRACHAYDKADFEVGDVFTPGFCLTCSAGITWEDKSKNRYIIKPLDVEHTKARNLFDIYDISEKQVTFLQDAKFSITAISDWGEGKKQIAMKEIQY